MIRKIRHFEPLSRRDWQRVLSKIARSYRQFRCLFQHSVLIPSDCGGSNFHLMLKPGHGDSGEGHFDYKNGCAPSIESL